jgi:hypothetical protein
MKFINKLLPIFLLALVLAQSSLAADQPILIHEPYWEKNQQSLKDYAKKIIKTISPYVITEGDLDRANKQVRSNGEYIKVRSVDEFGRVLPNIFLRQVLAKVGDEKRAVPKIFLLPKKDANIAFEFLLPHRTMSCNSGFNCIQVLSNSFEIFQEYIEGEGLVGDQSFYPYAHFDFNAKQIIDNKIDGKKYLIDTKEGKNFFLPQFSPYQESYLAYWLLKIGREIPQDASALNVWRDQQRSFMINRAEENFPAHEKSIEIDLGPFAGIDLTDILAIDYGNEVFNDNSEGERYFANPKDNIARYLYLGRADLLEKLFTQYPQVPRDNIVIPFMEKTHILSLNPVQFVLRSNQFSTTKKQQLLQYFSKEEAYFANSVAGYDTQKWPLYLALATGDKTIFDLVLNMGADVNGWIAGRSILHHCLIALAGADDEAKQDLDAIVKTILAASSQDNIDKVLLELFGVKSFGFSRETTIAFANMLLKHLNFIGSALIEKIFNFGERPIIESILGNDFDYEEMLMTTMWLVKEPSQDYIRHVHGDKSPVDYYWYELVNKILAEKSRFLGADKAIDMAISHALVNSKVSILCVLLKHIPADAPHMRKSITQIKNSTYEHASLLEQAIKTPCPRLVELLVVNGIPVNVLHIREAVARVSNDAVIDALLLSPTINLQSGLKEAIDSGNSSAAEKFLRAIHQKGAAPSSENYRHIFESTFEPLKVLARDLAGASNLGEGILLMDEGDIRKMIAKGDIKKLENLIDNNISLGNLLTQVVRHLIFAKQEGVSIKDYDPWYLLLGKLSKKDLPPKALDAAIASALTNSKTYIVKIFVDQLPKILLLPKEEQRTRDVVKEKIRDQYSRDSHYQNAVSIGSQVLLDMYAEEGMPAKVRK